MNRSRIALIIPGVIVALSGIASADGAPKTLSEESILAAHCSGIGDHEFADELYLGSVTLDFGRVADPVFTLRLTGLLRLVIGSPFGTFRSTDTGSPNPTFRMAFAGSMQKYFAGNQSILLPTLGIPEPGIEGTFLFDRKLNEATLSLTVSDSPHRALLKCISTVRSE